jgi:DNA-binding transcriptional ArsR family regulator
MKPSRLHKAATWYAHHGYHVFPLRPGTKVPATGNGFKEATTDTDQVDKWWTRNPMYNIGISCGPSGLVVLDFDTYKSGVHTDILFDDDDLVNSIISRTPHGGTHVWFRQPPDMTLTCARGELPQHVDVRGEGGYIVAPPSYLPESGAYAFSDGHRPTDFEGTQGLPDSIIEILRPRERVPHAPRTTQTASEREIADALGYIPKEMAYDEWLAILMAVHSIFPDERGVQLCEEWSPGYKGEIAKKFASFRNSGKSVATLFYQAMAHGYRPPQRAPMPDEGVRNKLFRLRGWVRSAAAIAHLKKNGVRRASELIPLLDALLILGHERGTCRVAIKHRTLAELCDIAPMTSWRRLEKLKETKMIDILKNDHGTIVDLSLLDTIVSDTDLYINTKNGESVSLTIEEMEWQASHRTDDAFTSYPYWSAVKRRGNLAPLMTSLGATGWLLWPHLERGGTVAELAEVTGLSVATIRHSIRKFMSLGLVPLEEVNKDGEYRLASGADDRLDSVRTHMQTFGVGLMRRGRSFSEGADYAAYKLRQRKKMEPKDVAFWEGVRDRNDREAAMYFDLLDKVGFNARMKVGKEKAVRHRIKIDHGEEWRTWGRPLFDAYNALGDAAVEQKIRLLTIAHVGADAAADHFRRAYRAIEEKVEMMMMMAPKRAKYEWKPMETDEPAPVRMGFEQLAFELEAIPHG